MKQTYKVFAKAGKFPAPGVDTLVAQIDIKDGHPVVWCGEGYTVEENHES